MEKKIGRTFAEAVNEYYNEHGDLEGFHRDVDEVLADKSISDAFDKVLGENPDMERKFWEDSLKMNVDIHRRNNQPDNQWIKNIREALETGKFPPKPVEDE